MNANKNNQNSTENNAFPSESHCEIKKVELKINIPTEVYCQLMRKAQKEGKRPEQLVAEVVVSLGADKQ